MRNTNNVNTNDSLGSTGINPIKSGRKPRNSNAGRSDNGKGGAIGSQIGAMGNTNTSVATTSGKTESGTYGITPAVSTNTTSSAGRAASGNGSGNDNSARTDARTDARTGANQGQGNALVDGLVTEVEPLPKVKRKYTKRAKATSTLESSDELVRLAILTAANTLVKTAFNVVAIVAKDKTWNLNDEESVTLASDIDSCLALLPEGQYELVIKYLTTLSPFASLATNLAGIIKKRVENKQHTTNAASTASSKSSSTPSSSQSNGFGGDWRFNPEYAITGLNN